MENVEKVYEIRSDTFSACPICDQSIGSAMDPDSPERVNHLIQEHGCRLLHVGQETDEGQHGAYQVTVYVLSA